MFIPLDDMEAALKVAKDINKDPKYKSGNIRATGLEIKDGAAWLKLTTPKFKPRYVKITEF